MSRRLDSSTVVFIGHDNVDSSEFIA
jgi:hypothetical protein